MFHTHILGSYMSLQLWSKWNVSLPPNGQGQGTRMFASSVKPLWLYMSSNCTSRHNSPFKWKTKLFVTFTYLLQSLIVKVAICSCHSFIDGRGLEGGYEALGQKKLGYGKGSRCGWGPTHITRLMTCSHYTKYCI